MTPRIESSYRDVATGDGMRQGGDRRRARFFRRRVTAAQKVASSRRDIPSGRTRGLGRRPANGQNWNGIGRWARATPHWADWFICKSFMVIYLLYHQPCFPSVNARVNVVQLSCKSRQEWWPCMRWGFASGREGAGHRVGTMTGGNRGAREVSVSFARSGKGKVFERFGKEKRSRRRISDTFRPHTPRRC